MLPVTGLHTFDDQGFPRLLLVGEGEFSVTVNFHGLVS